MHVWTFRNIPISLRKCTALQGIQKTLCSFKYNYRLRGKIRGQKKKKGQILRGRIRGQKTTATTYFQFLAYGYLNPREEEIGPALCCLYII